MTTFKNEFMNEHFDFFELVLERNLSLTCKTLISPLKSSLLLIKIYNEHELISSTRCEFESTDFLDETDSFKSHSVVLGNSVYIYVYGSQGLFLFKYNLRKNQISFKKRREIVINDNSKVLFCEREQTVILASKNEIQIWDKNLKFKIFSQKFCQVILGIYFSSCKEFLVIYDFCFYYEFEISKLEIVDKHPYYSEGESTLTQKVEIDLFAENQRVHLPRLDKVCFDLQIVSKLATFSFKDFSFYNLFRLFSKKDYAQYFDSFQKYYFTRACKHLWGQLNPFVFAIYHNDEALLKSILKHNDFPQICPQTSSVVEYALSQGHFTLVQSLCSKLSTKKKPQYISKVDFLELIKNQAEYGHHLVSKQLGFFTCFENYNLMHMRSSVEVILSTSKLNFLYKFRNSQVKIRKHNKKLMELCKLSDEAEHLQKSYLNQLNMSHVEIVSLPFEFDFSTGSPEGLAFFECYASTSDDKLVQSDWKYLIEYKWRRFYWSNFFIACMSWLLMILATLKIIFLKSSPFVKYASSALVFFFLILEFFQCLTYMVYKPKLYFLSVLNWIDLFLFTFLVYYLYGKQPNETVHRFNGTLVLMGLYYRGFMYLTIIRSFTSLVGIINTIISKILIFLFILVYFFLASSMIFRQLDSSFESYQYFFISYIWVLFGGVEKSDLDTNFYIIIPIFFGTIFINIILLNVLIAYLSNLFSRLEEEQEVKRLQRQASIIMDTEVMHYFTRKVSGGFGYKNVN